MQLFESVSRWLADIPVVRRARNGPRVEVNEQVLVSASGAGATHLALLRNLSIGGACIRCDLRLSRGDVLRLRANGESEDEFEFTACVVAVRPSELGFFADYGLRLVELNVDSARVLGQYIGRRIHDSKVAHGGEIPR